MRIFKNVLKSGDWLVIRYTHKYSWFDLDLQKYQKYLNKALRYVFFLNIKTKEYIRIEQKTAFERMFFNSKLILSKDDDLYYFKDNELKKMEKVFLISRYSKRTYTNNRIRIKAKNIVTVLFNSKMEVREMKVYSADSEINIVTSTPNLKIINNADLKMNIIKNDEIDKNFCLFLYGKQSKIYFGFKNMDIQKHKALPEEEKIKINQSIKNLVML